MPSRTMVPVVIAAFCLMLAGCSLPWDPDGTLDRVRGGVLRVGALEAAPWIRLDGGKVTGVEARLVEQLAQDLHARIEWVRGGGTGVLSGLQAGELDLVVGGFTAETPWTSELGASRPYLTTQTVLAVAPDAPAPASLKKVRVAVRRGDPAGGVLRGKGAEVAPVDAIQAGDAPAAVEDWRAPALGLKPTQTVLVRQRHLFLTAPGENGWILAVDRFLAGKEAAVRAQLEAEARR